MDLGIRQDFHELIPPINPEEYKLLEESIKEEGCRDPIVVWGNTIVDGFNRYEICRNFRIEFKTLKKKFQSEEDAKIWIIRNQLARRNLPPAERVRLALMLKPMIEAEAKKQQGTRTDICLNLDKSPINTMGEIAKAAGVARDTVHKVETVIKKGTPEVREAMKKGKISVHKAYKKTTKKTTPRKPSWGPGDSDDLTTLKIVWRRAKESDRKKFLKWIKKEGQK